MTPRQLLKRVFPPMLATLAGEAPHDDRNWTYELKYDGFRVVAAVVDGEAAMLSRNELDLAARFPRIHAALKKLKIGEIVVDGEVVVLDEQGAPRFQLLQQGGNEKMFLFDVLWLEGEDLRRKPYIERRKILEKLCAKAPEGITVSKILKMSGEEALKFAAGAGWEGIIAKHNQSVYEPRRSKQWLKVKALQQQELVVIGWQPSSANAKDVGSLHLAVNEKGSLRYAGKVGTGFNARMRTFLRETMEKDRVDSPPASEVPKIRDANWVKPRLVAQVAFTEWTGDHRLRHPSFLGLREDKEVKDVVRETVQEAQKAARKAPKKKSTQSGTSKVTLTNPDRLLYPRDGIRKADVVAYYEAVAEPMLRALEDRPLSLEHWNQGIDKPSWFQQGITQGPDWLHLVETPTRTTKSGSVKHLIADSVDALRWLGQMSALTVHMWASRTPKLEQPDWILFDLDPAKGKGIEQAIEAAIVMRRLLENLELPSVPKTSGKRGIHIFVPLAAGYTHEQVADFACAIAAAVSAQVPTMTVERTISKRRGRLYLDCMQNGYGKTVVAPYSLRAIDGAPVSAPLKWSEITKKLDPAKFNLRTMPARLAKVGDLFADVFKNRAKLPKIG
jgi:bifunctional non-homologous end joining protein LigD